MPEPTCPTLSVMPVMPVMPVSGAEWEYILSLE